MMLNILLIQNMIGRLITVSLPFSLLQRIGAPLSVCIKDLQVPNRAASRHDDGEFPDHSDPGTVDRGGDSR